MADSQDPQPAYDGLTISRLMVLIAGLGAGIALFAPEPDWDTLSSNDGIRQLATAVFIGLSLPGPLYTIRRQGRSLGLGGTLWLTLGLGVWLFLPPAIYERAQVSNSMGLSAFACLVFTMPLAALWFVLAMLLTGQLSKRAFGRDTAWRDRFGAFLGIASMPLGLWVVFEIYASAFGR